MARKHSAFAEFLSFLFAGAVIDLTAVAPRSWGYAMWRSFGNFIWNSAKSRQRVTTDNLANALPSLPAEDRERVGRESVVNSLFIYTELCWMGSMNADNLDSFITYDGWEHLQNAYTQDKGVIVASIHQLNGEMMSAGMAVRGMPVSWVIREVDNRWLDAKLDKIRHHCKLKVIKKEKAMQKMLKVLRDKEVLSFTTDQKASLNGIWVKFLGQWSATHKSPAVMHLRTGAPIVPLFSVPDENGIHRAYFLPALQYRPTGNQKLDVFSITQMLADLQSAFIAKHPELWLWMHRRWSITPSTDELKEAEELTAQANYNIDLSQVR